MLIKKWNKTRKVFLYYVRLINEQGKKQLYAPGHTSKKVASQFEAKLKNEIAERKMFPDRFFPRVKFSDLAQEYLKKHAARTRSYPEYSSISNKLIKAFGDLCLHEIQRQKIESYQAERSAQVGPGMVNREITILKGMFTKAVDWGYIAKNPVKGIKLAKEKERTRFLKGYERAKLIQAAGAKGRPWYLKSLIIIDLLTGLRKSELLRVGWEEIDLERNVLQVLEGKGGETRFVPINVNARAEILALAKKAKGKYLFHDSHGRPLGEINKAFNQAVKKAGLENVRFHDLRRTFATECALNRVPPKTLQKWLGHKLIRNTMNIYVVSPDEFEQEAIKRLDGMCDTQADTPKNGGPEEGAKTLENIGVAGGDRTFGPVTIGNDCGNWGGV
jgi:integrase